MKYGLYCVSKPKGGLQIGRVETARDYALGESALALRVVTGDTGHYTRYPFQAFVFLFDKDVKMFVTDYPTWVVPTAELIDAFESAGLLEKIFKQVRSDLS